MSKAKFIQENGETILPITHEEVVLDNDGKNLPSKYQQKQDENLLTDAKTIVGAINELSTKGGGEVTSDDVKFSDGTTVTDAHKDTISYIEDVEAVAYENKADIEEAMTVAYENKAVIGASELATNDKTLTGAINELFQSANNGKQLIADAIGEPLNSEDTFSAMSNDINGLLSTFKTNMMKNGITIESGDKFKSLIDKIATMVEESSGKGIQIIQGSLETSDLITRTYAYLRDEKGNGGTTPWVCFDASVLGFNPSIILINFLYGTNTVYDAIYDNMIKKEYYLRAYNKSQGYNGAYSGMKVPDVINTASLILPLLQEEQLKWGITNIQYIAIGVGEEDTTLRDSLADILENKGVDVTEDDDMASLISKVDSISSGLDIISATELPATGRENQICVITDNPVDNFLITSDTTHYNGDTNVIMAHTATANNNVEPLVLINNNMTQYIHFSKMIQGNAAKISYIYKNNEWIEYTPAELVLLRNGVIYNEMYKPGDYSSMGYDTTYEEGKGLTITVETDSYNYELFSSYTRIDFSLYNTLFIKIKKLESYAHTCVALAIDSKPSGSLDKGDGIAHTYSFSTPGGTTRELYIDVSTWTGEYYLAIGPEGTDNTYSFLVSDVYLY